MIRATTALAGTDSHEPADRELWRATQLDALELEQVPSELHFVRDHFPPPAFDPSSWTLQLTGTVQTLVLDLEGVRSLPRRTLAVVLECAGHRRSEFTPIPSGVPWSCGALGEARWTGASLSELLQRAGIPQDALEVVLEGADAGPVPGLEGTHRFARSLPLAKALDRDVLLAYEMNGEPIPVPRGGPVRAIVPGWYATDSVKWLGRIWFSREEFDGFFQAQDYRLQVPGESGPGERMTDLPVNALITSPIAGQPGLAAGAVQVRGIAWGGAGAIAQVLVRVDLAQWRAAHVTTARGRYARTRWELDLTLTAGPHQITCRAIDGAGQAQPHRPMANVRGYANNSVHSVNVCLA